MEYRNEFSLNKSVENWIKNLANTKALNNPDLEELESHLFDEIENLKTKGLTDEESFFIATKRLGKQEILTEEYGKINNSFYTKITPYLKGILIYFTFFGFIDILKSITYFILQPTLESVSPAEISIIANIALGLVGFALIFITLKSDQIPWNKINSKLNLTTLVFLSLSLTIIKPLSNYLVNEYSSINYDQISNIHINYMYFETIALILIFIYSIFINLKNKRINKIKVAK